MTVQSGDMSGRLSARHEHVRRGWKNLAQTEGHPIGAREWFADLLWLAFPADSERELSRNAARALQCSPRQVINWLRCENDASLSVVVKVMAAAGAELMFQKLEGKRQ